MHQGVQLSLFNFKQDDLLNLDMYMHQDMCITVSILSHTDLINLLAEWGHEAFRTHEYSGSESVMHGLGLGSAFNLGTLAAECVCLYGICCNWSEHVAATTAFSSPQAQGWPSPAFQQLEQ